MRLILHFEVICGDGHYRPICGASGWGFSRNEGTTRSVESVTCSKCKKRAK